MIRIVPRLAIAQILSEAGEITCARPDRLAN